MEARSAVSTPLPRFLCALNVACLDAPLVALAWQGALGHAFHVRVAGAARAALFFATWAIYLFDRLADGASLRAGEPASLRQRVARRWSGMGVVLLGAVLFALALCVPALDRWLLVGGVVIGILCGAYLTTNRCADRTWRALPIKELTIGTLFALGTAAVLLPYVREPGVIASVALLSILCATNCAMVAAWERELDAQQGKTSLGTRWPRLATCLPFVVVALTIAATIAHVPLAVSLPLSASALLLGLLHALRNVVPADERTALADLVLLVPLLPLFVAR